MAVIDRTPIDLEEIEGGVPKQEVDEYSKDKTTTWSASMDVERSLTILALCFCFTGSNIGSFFTGPGLTYIAQGLEIGIEQSWLPTSSSLAGACTVTCIGYLQDMVGRRASLAGGLFCTLFGSILFATAQTFAQAVVACTFMGIGSNIQELTSIAAIAELVPAKRRGLYLAFPTLLSACFGPAVLYANELSIHASWRWLFWICLIWNGLTAIMLCFTYFRLRMQHTSMSDPVSTIKDIDFVGIALLTIGLALLLVAVQSGGIIHPWNSTYVLVQLIMGIILLLLLAVWEFRAQGRPLIPIRLFKGQRVVALTFIVCIIAGMNYSTVLNLGPTIIEEVFQFSPLKDGLVALGPSIALAVGASAGNALLSASEGRCRESLVIFTVIMTTFLGAQAVVKPGSYIVFTTMSSICSVGIGASLIPLTTIVTLACPQDLIGTGVALTIALRTLGGSIGYAIFYNIYQSHLKTNFAKSVGTAILRAGLPSNETIPFLEAFEQDPLSLAAGADIPYANSTVLAAAHLGYGDAAAAAARLVYLVTLAFGALAICGAVCLPNMKVYMTKQVLTKTLSNKSGA